MDDIYICMVYTIHIPNIYQKSGFQMLVGVHTSGTLRYYDIIGKLWTMIS